MRSLIRLKENWNSLPALIVPASKQNRSLPDGYRMRFALLVWVHRSRYLNDVKVISVREKSNRDAAELCELDGAVWALVAVYVVFGAIYTGLRIRY